VWNQPLSQTGAVRESGTPHERPKPRLDTLMTA
jgi:hypothetical protein